MYTDWLVFCRFSELSIRSTEKSVARLLVSSCSSPNYLQALFAAYGRSPISTRTAI